MIDSTDPIVSEIRQVVQQIALVSHAPIQGYNFAPSEVGRGERWRTSSACRPCRRRGLIACEHKGPIAHLGQHSSSSGDTMTPTGDIDRYADFQVEYRQKSHLYFQRAFSRLMGREDTTRTDFEALLAEAKDALLAWRKTPEYQVEQDPPRGSFRWKCAIADDTRDVDKIKSVYFVSPATIYRYRIKYRGVRKGLS